MNISMKDQCVASLLAIFCLVLVSSLWGPNPADARQVQKSCNHYADDFNRSLKKFQSLRDSVANNREESVSRNEAFKQLQKELLSTTTLEQLPATASRLKSEINYLIKKTKNDRHEASRLGQELSTMISTWNAYVKNCDSTKDPAAHLHWQGVIQNEMERLDREIRYLNLKLKQLEGEGL